MSAIDEYAAYVKSCRTRGVLPCSLESFRETLRLDVRTWRERIGAKPDFPLHAPNDVERAMVEEIAELRAALAPRPAVAEQAHQLAEVAGFSIQYQDGKHEFKGGIGQIEQLLATHSGGAVHNPSRFSYLHDTRAAFIEWHQDEFGYCCVDEKSFTDGDLQAVAWAAWKEAHARIAMKQAQGESE